MLTVSEGETWRGWSRGALHAKAEHYYKAGGVTEPEVALVSNQGQRAIFKDYGRTPGWFGLCIAPLLIAREASALRRLEGLRGIPRLYRQIDRRAILIEYFPANTWPEVRPPDDAYSRLEALIDAMHRRGVAHCDLRAARNILVDDQGQPFVVDFVARVHRGAAWNLPWRWLFRQFKRADRHALAKLRLRYAPHLASEADRRRAGYNRPLERAARLTGARIRDFVRFLVGRSS